MGENVAHENFAAVVMHGSNEAILVPANVEDRELAHVVG
jgi:hypothetical protein